jgi:hypothetical protein
MGHFNTIALYTEKIDNAPIDGVEGVENSLGYHVESIHDHFHSVSRTLGKAAVPDGEVHIADHIGPGILPFQVDAGNLDWGSWVQILGSGDSPVSAGNAEFDPRFLTVTATEKTANYFIQIGWGASGAAALSAGSFTERSIVSDTNKYKDDLELHTIKILAGTKLWARCLCYGENTGTIDFYFSIHEYKG